MHAGSTISGSFKLAVHDEALYQVAGSVGRVHVQNHRADPSSGLSDSGPLGESDNLEAESGVPSPVRRFAHCLHPAYLLRSQ